MFAVVYLHEKYPNTSSNALQTIAFLVLLLP